MKYDRITFSKDLGYYRRINDEGTTFEMLDSVVSIDIEKTCCSITITVKLQIDDETIYEIVAADLAEN